jgi:hypothetical protein
MAHSLGLWNILQVYEVDPLTCIKCRGSMRVIAFNFIDAHGLLEQHRTTPSILYIGAKILAFLTF